MPQVKAPTLGELMAERLEIDALREELAAADAEIHRLLLDQFHRGIRP